MGFDARKYTDATNVVTAFDEDGCSVLEFDDTVDFT